MDEQEFTEPGKAGQNIRSGLSTLFKNYKRGFINPILNIVPGAVNLSAAGTEAAAGMLNIPYRAGRLPLYETGPEVSPPTTGKKETIQETPIQQEEEIPTITVSKPRRKQSAQKLYRVMYAGKGAEASEIYETKDEADAALKKAGGKGAVAGINLSQKTRGGEMLSAEEIEARKQKYIDQLSQTKQKELDRLQRIQKEPDRLKRIQALRNPQTEEEIMRVAENKGRMEEALKAANEEKRAKDKEAGAEFAGWRSKVKAGRESENQLRLYNKQLGLLKQAYTQAKQAGDPITALAINQAINSYTAGVPMEMGARKRAAEKGIVSERNKMMADKMQAAQEEEAKRRQTAAANSDFNQYNQGQNLITRKPVGF